MSMHLLFILLLAFLGVLWGSIPYVIIIGGLYIFHFYSLAFWVTIGCLINLILGTIHPFINPAWYERRLLESGFRPTPPGLQVVLPKLITISAGGIMHICA